ncbi:Mitochondrial import inner membrane translocase subunit TIM10 [Sparassis crispa]|uniref:Mitochondrial import inner membrane translocase subunit n=1 Tax=Sparassis crispa TaxID=139825 RepID=A0A401G7I5_9APHY|nr:Mitochondrial import inner membrane translocase subunit TIM10 [Sparassis crispa]GBE78135.1 Mitochondrial import inner membrane translocase subunit TIM10 [Sparassis crispa]
MAVQELDMITDVFNRLVSSCHAKCISPRYAEGDLNKGESVCIDRCVAKFFEVNKKVGEKLQNMGANAGAAAGGQSAFGSL